MFEPQAYLVEDKPTLHATLTHVHEATRAWSSSGPGAMPVSGGCAVFHVVIHDLVSPGEEVHVRAGGRMVQVRCPTDSRLEQTLQITVQVDPDCSSSAPPTRNPEIPPDSPNVSGVDDPNAIGGSAAYTPKGFIHVVVSCFRSLFKLGISCLHAQTVRRGMRDPTVPVTDLTKGPSGPHDSGQPNDSRPPKDNKSQLLHVEVPPGVTAGQPLALLAGGVRIMVTCPHNASPGQRIRFELPLAITQKPRATNEAARIKLSYDKDGWQRMIRLSDMIFQWVRVDDKGDTENNTRFHTTKSAYVRKLEFRPGTDPRIRAGILSLVPATEGIVDSRIMSADNRDLVSYSDIANAQVKSFEEKAHWFQHKCDQLRLEWNEGHMRMNVRRQFLLGDSVDAVMSLSRQDLRKFWRFEFNGEMGVDAGGLAREWFQLVTEEIFDPDMGLWQSSAVNQMCMEINPASEYNWEDHLIYYRFLGRVMGKALFDRQLVAGHMVQNIYKHMLGWPITFSDLEMVDEEYYNNMKSLETMSRYGEDISMLCLDFSMTQEIMGVYKTIDLIKDGAKVDVTNENLPEYLEACLKYRMLDRVKPQLNELLLGFFDVIPEPLLTIFDFQELELLMCGLPEIEMADWMEHTEYSGKYDRIGAEHQACKWFWEVVTEFDHEMKARLLQFVTGTSGVPSRGFGVLQGNDGNIRRFTIYGVALGDCPYPRAHTCFNRLDLPMYESKAELEEKLKLAVTMVATGFDIE